MHGPVRQAAPLVKRRAAPRDRRQKRDPLQRRGGLIGQPGIDPLAEGRGQGLGQAIAGALGRHQPPSRPGGADQPLAILARRTNPGRQPQRQPVGGDAVATPPAE